MGNELLSARELLLSGGYTCVLLRRSETHTSTARGVKPLLTLLDAGTDLSAALPQTRWLEKPRHTFMSFCAAGPYTPR